MKWLTECRKPNEMSALLPFKKITYTTAGHLCRNYIELARTSQKISPLILRRGPSWRTSPRSCRRLSEINVPGAPVTCNTPAAAPAEGNQRRLPPTLSSSIMTSSHNVHTSQKPFLSFFSLNHQKSWTGNVDENDWSVRFTLWALNITYSILFPLNSNANTFQFEAPLIRCDASSVSHGDTPLSFLKDSWRRKILEDEKTEVCPGMTTSDYKYYNYYVDH